MTKSRLSRDFVIYKAFFETQERILSPKGDIRQRRAVPSILRMINEWML
ncbi:MAG: hypothetical protein JWQ54_3899 [Mucilaginibacter sp.]|nr:hypothetical protein [Mucilaginibacter sp.]